jgi:hypothetical protein
MGKVLHQTGDVEHTAIINPQVQENLNDLIKTQREKIVRMSASLSMPSFAEGSAKK